MIYTATLNLAIDLFIDTKEMSPHIVNRTEEYDVQANGKGVNVSLILEQLGVESTALGFKAGFTGDFIEDTLRGKGIKTDFIGIEGITRINVFTHVKKDNLEYKLVNKGPKVTPEQVEEFLNQVQQLKENDYLCLSGSFPEGVSAECLKSIAEICKEKKVKLIIDTSYPEVLETLTYEPFLLKPNDEELAQWFNVEIKTQEEAVRYGKKLVEQGAQNVLISLGGEGALFINKDEIWSVNAPRGEVVNTACAGDSLLGTFLAGWVKNEPLGEILQKATAAGSSTAFQKGLTDFSDVPELMEQITITEIINTL
ncbi:1-phosphofructokinase [Lactococcus garvieae]|uniref:1-phosphofructokinase n=1 Tax=Lactococcus garvieae TaxID=1363 RepID=UPI0009C0091D|nr:1-phosphofructokinase [Lactococcus garvieae]